MASGLERRRNFSEETDDDYPDSVVGRPVARRHAIALAITNLTDIGTIYATVS